MELSTSIPLTVDGNGGAVGELLLEEGQSNVLVFGPEPEGQACWAPSRTEADELFECTVRYWQNWLSACTYHGRWREQVQRSALALKLLTFEPTGALVAAATTSLPEVIGGSRNWDYRYSWFRDGSFTVYALIRLGFRTEAIGFGRWLQNYAAKTLEPGKPPPPMYTLYGEPVPLEQELTHWEGYRGSRPVRIGNGAATQFQNDISGEIMDTVYLHNKHVVPIDADSWSRLRRVLDETCERWMLPDNGIWETRGGPVHHVYSKVMNWVALDRGLRLADKRSFPGDRERWLRTRDEIYEQILDKGWNPDRKAFTMSYGSDDLDAALLIMPLCFFMAPNDPRMLSTIEALMQNPQHGGLTRDGLLYRYPPDARIDGLKGQEGSLNICTFWLVEALTRAGRVLPDKLDEARLLFERMLSYANHVGLYAEQIGPEGEALGNFPQAFTHLSLISAAFNLDRALGGTSPS
jgi:GH15 family glucan-1,4-alpha-glucosidase